MLRICLLVLGAGICGAALGMPGDQIWLSCGGAFLVGFTGMSLWAELNMLHEWVNSDVGRAP